MAIDSMSTATPTALEMIQTLQTEVDKMKKHLHRMQKAFDEHQVTFQALTNALNRKDIS